MHTLLVIGVTVSLILIITFAVVAIINIFIGIDSERIENLKVAIFSLIILFVSVFCVTICAATLSTYFPKGTSTELTDR